MVVHPLPLLMSYELEMPVVVRFHVKIIYTCKTLQITNRKSVFSMLIVFIETFSNIIFFLTIFLLKKLTPFLATYTLSVCPIHFAHL